MLFSKALAFVGCATPVSYFTSVCSYLLKPNVVDACKYSSSPIGYGGACLVKRPILNAKSATTFHNSGGISVLVQYRCDIIYHEL